MSRHNDRRKRERSSTSQRREPDLSRDVVRRATRRRVVPPVELNVHNEIPLASGLGSSAAAIVAGIKLAGLLTGKEIADQTILNYATEFEGHPDNVAASLYGGFLASCISDDGTVLSAKFDWPRRSAWSLSRLTHNCRHTSHALRCREWSAVSTLFTTCNELHSSPPPSRSSVTTCCGKRCAIVCTSHSENHSSRTRRGTGAATHARTAGHRVERRWSKYRRFGRKQRGRDRRSASRIVSRRAGSNRRSELWTSTTKAARVESS